MPESGGSYPYGTLLHSHMTSGRMQAMWDQRARHDAFYYVESAFWNGDVAAFFQLGEDRARLLIDPVLSSLELDAANATALEVGCGLGRFSRALARRFRQVFALDVSAEMVRRARELHASREYGNIEFITTDGRSFNNVPEHTVDFVYSYEVFQHMPSVGVILDNLREVTRALRPTGAALIHLRTQRTLSIATLRMVVKRLLPERLWQRLGYAPLTFDATWTGTSLDARTIEALCRRAGLRVADLLPDTTHPPGERTFLLARPDTVAR